MKYRVPHWLVALLGLLLFAAGAGADAHAATAQATDPLLQVAQYGWPGIIALALVWAGRMANKLVDAHLATMSALVERLSTIHATTQETDGKLDALLAKARAIGPGRYSDVRR